jgi:tetratricopeptide (TPR) repeat protein
MKKTSLLLIALLSIVVVQAQVNSKWLTPQLKSAEAKYYARDFDGAEEEFAKMYEQDSTNPYLLIDMALYPCEVWTDAYSALEFIEMAEKYFPANDNSPYRPKFFYVKTMCYYLLDEHQKAIDAASELVKHVAYDKDLKIYKYMDAYLLRGLCYFYMDKYDNAEKDFLKYRELEGDRTTDTRASSYLVKIELKRKNYDKALKRINEAIDYDNRYIAANKGMLPNDDLRYMKAQAYIGKGNRKEAAKAMGEAVIMNFDYQCVFTLEDSLTQDLMNTNFADFESSLLAKAEKNGFKGFYAYNIGEMYENRGEYKKAYAMYQKCVDCEKNLGRDLMEGEVSYLASAYLKLITFNINFCNYDQALRLIDEAYAFDKSHPEFYIRLKNDDLIEARANCYSYKGDAKAAADEITKLISKNGYSYYYATRAGYYHSGNMTMSAIADINKAISLLEAPIYYERRAYYHKAEGDTEAMTADLKKVLELSAKKPQTATAYAYVELGEKQKAFDVVKQLLNEEPTSASYHYNAACIYCLAGDSKKALHHLEEAFKLGWCSFAHLDHDSDLNLIKKTSEFKTLLKKYKIQIP